MKTRFAFAGFRHAHILDLLGGLEERDDAQVVACCEEDATARAELAQAGRVEITHTDFAEMLRTVPSDVVAIGDYYSRRGAIAIEALRAGRHVLSDKPLCTTLEKLAEIERLVVQEQLLVGLQLDSRGYGSFIALRGLLRRGDLGDICTIRIDGQHPLRLGTRSPWYFEPGKHGGTINDIGIHAFDFVPWLTGLDWREIAAARSWNAKARDLPHFHDCAQILGVLSNGAGVMADFSYLAPDRLGYDLPQYWRIVVHGTLGFAETHLLATEITVVTDADAAPQIIAAAPPKPRAYLDDFLAELRGHGGGERLCSADCLRATRLALEAERDCRSASKLR